VVWWCGMLFTVPRLFVRYVIH